MSFVALMEMCDSYLGRNISWKVFGASLPISETTVNLSAAMLRR
jgi:hypothetical protein